MPASMDELCYLPISALGPELQTRRLSPVELLDAYLSRVHRFDDRVHAFITLTADLAMSATRTAEAEIRNGEYRGPLHGVPIALKDLYDTAGIRTTGHSQLFAERVPTQDSTCTRLLADAGTILMGKLSMHEFAYGPADPDGFFPPAHNPWDLSRVPSGSSSGSGAGLAAGLFAGSLGSDTGGSIRGPASMCNIVGHKPTYGLCSRSGVLPLAWTLDHAGPMARSVEDCAILLQAIAGYDPRDPGSASVPIPDYRATLRDGLRGLRVGAPLAYLEQVPDLVTDTFAAYRAALTELERLGAEVAPVEMPEADHLEVVGATLLQTEAYAYHRENFIKSPELYGRNFYERVRPAALLSSADYIDVLRGRARIKRAFGQLMQRIDLLALPTFPYPARTFEEDLNTPAWARTSFTRPFNITGMPAISLPCGFSSTNLPIGLQLAGRPFEDALVLRAAYAYEQATDWHTRWPRLRDED